MRKKAYYSAYIITWFCGKRKKKLRERSSAGGAFASCRQRLSPQKQPAAEHRGQGKQNVKFYSVTSPEISLIADTVAARFCMSLGTISLVAFPSATFWKASSAFSLMT